MLRKSFALGSCLAATLVVAGCADQTTAPVTTPSTRTAVVASPLFEGLSRSGGPGAFGLSAPVADLSTAAVDRLINRDDYVCSSASPISAWLTDAIITTATSSLAERLRLITLANNLADQVPTFNAILFERSAAPQSYGTRGQFTKAIVKAERDVKGFWDIPSNDIEVVAMHGTSLANFNQSVITYQLVFEFGPDSAIAKAAANRKAVLESTTDIGNHPVWTFNAVSFAGLPQLGLPKKIVMGDGILEGFAALGFNDVAPLAIFAHEFAHQIQFANNYFLGEAGDAPLPTPADQLDGLAAERTRYSELMADAMAAYYLTHARGGTLRQKRVEQFLTVFYQLGDCGFTDGGHHGTPNQRLAAARFGFQIANAAQKQGHIMTAEQFHALFVAQYPTIIAPDARTIAAKTITAKTIAAR